MPPEGVPARPPRHEVSAFAFEGRLAVRQGETRHYANIAWRHDAAHDEILLTTPLGQGVAELARDATGARLTMADRRRFEAPDWEALSAQVFGAPLPLAGLPRWLLGETLPPDAGWHFEILDRESASPDALPILIEMKREDIELRLKIDEWSEVR